jgi:hypothetical protein
VLCVHCGFDRRTGLQVGFGPQRTGAKRGVTFTFPVVKVAVVAGILAVLAAGWFLVGAPLLSKMGMTNAVGYVTNGDLRKAQTAFEELQPKLSGADRERVDLWLQQLPLELEKNSGKTLDQGIQVKSETIVMALGKGRATVADRGIVFVVTITNKGTAPLTLRNECFYLRGFRDIVLVPAGHGDNTLDGTVVGPGESKEGDLAFVVMPREGVRRTSGPKGRGDMGPGEDYFLIFNDGRNYVKCWLPF